MGLLEKAIAKNNLNLTSTGGSARGELLSLIANFHDKNPLFHCIVLRTGAGKEQKLVQDITGMVSSHGAACADLSGGKCLVLLPGALDMELFAHRLSNSTGSTTLLQSSANVYSLAIETLGPYFG